ncbi:MAG: hypothetical protein KDA78_04035 [Planctomycetaceae bacterium]|nr:hypothetical protein [Planctomycetaceae bacterium]
MRDDAESPDRTEITLTFREPISQRIRVQMQGIQLNNDSADWNIATLFLKGATTHTGGLALSSPSEIRVKTLMMEGIRPATRQWNPEETYVALGPVQFYDLWREDFEFRLSAEQMSREVQAAASHRLHVGEFEMQLSAVFTLQTLFAPLHELKLTIPESWSVVTVRQDQAELEWQLIRATGQPDHIVIALSPALKPDEHRTVSVIVRQAIELPDETAVPVVLPLPELKLDDVNVLEGTYTIAANPRLKVVPQQMTGMDSAELGTPDELFGYRYQNAKIGGQLSIQRKSTRFDVSTTTLIDAEERLIEAKSVFLLNISGGGLRTLELELPQEVNELAEIISLSPARISRQQQKTENGSTTWLLTFDRHVVGPVSLALSLNFPYEPGQEFSLTQFVFPGAELAVTNLAFLSDDRQYVDARVTSEDGQAFEMIDPADLAEQHSFANNRVIAAYRLTEPAQVSLTVQQLEAAPIPAGIGQLLMMETKWIDEEIIEQRAELNFQAVGIPHLLVLLPEGSVLWSTLVNGNPVPVRKDGAAYQVPILNRLQDSGQTLQLIYRSVVEPRTGLTSRKYDIPLPKFAIEQGKGAPQEMALLQVNWELHHESSEEIESLSPGMTRAESPVPHTWLSRVIEQLRQTSLSGFLVNLAWGCGLLLVPLILTRLIVLGFIQLSDHRLRWPFALLLVFVAGGSVLLLLLSKMTLSHAPPEMMSVDRVGSTAQETDEYYDYSVTRSMEDMPVPATAPAGVSLGLADAENPQSVTEPQSDSLITEAKKARRMRVENAQNRPLATPEAPPVVSYSNAGKDEVEKLSEVEVQVKEQLESDLRLNTAGRTILAQPLGEEQKREEYGLVGEGEGFLSLALEWTIPEHFRKTTLNGMSAPEVFSVRVHGYELGQRMQWLITALILLAYWLMRHSSLLSRFTLLILTLGVPLAAAGVSGAVFHSLLEAMLLGTVLGCLLWILQALWGWLASGSKLCLMWLLKERHKWVATGIMLLLIPCGSVFAEEKQPVEPAPPAKIPLVFPYGADESPLAADQVYVPKDVYLNLWKQAHPEEQLDPAPVAHQVVEASYQASVTLNQPTPREHTIVLKARFVIQSYRDAEQIITIPIQGALLSKMEINGAPVAAATDNKGLLSAVVKSRGLHLIDAEFRFPAEAIGAAGQFSLQLQPVASGSFSFSIPGESSLLRINDGTIPYRLVKREQETIAEFAISQGGTFTLSWQPVVSSAQLQFLSCTSTRQVSVLEQGIELRYTYQFEIAQGTFSELELEIPEGVFLKSLAGNDVAGWTRLANGRLRIQLKQAIDHQTVLTMALFSPLEVSTERVSFVCPDVVPQGVTREIGDWSIGWDPLIDVNINQAEGLRQRSTEGFQPLGQQPLLIAPKRVYRFTARPQNLQLEIQRKRTQTTATHHTLVDLQPHKMHLATVIQAQLQGEPRSALEVQLPAGFRPIEVNANDLRDWFSSDEVENQPRTLTVLFHRPLVGNVQLAIRGYIPLTEADYSAITIRGFKLLNTTQSSEYVGIGANSAFELAATSSQHARSIPPGELPPLAQQTAAFPVQFAFVNTDASGIEVVMQMRQEAPQLSASSVSVVAVSPTTVDLGISLQWVIRKGATDQFRFLGPAWMKGRTEFQSPYLRQVLTEEVGEDKTLFVLETRSPISSQFLVTATISLPLPADSLVKVPALEIIEDSLGPEGDPVRSTLEIQNHYAVLVNLGLQTLEPTSNHEEQIVSARELPLEVSDELVRQSVEVINVLPGNPPSWKLLELEPQESPPATVFLTEMTTVLTATGEYRTSSVMTVKNRGRQFLPLILPENELLISVLVEGRPSRAVLNTLDGQKVWMIALPPKGDADLAFDVAVITQGKLAVDFRHLWFGKTITMQRPEILSLERSAEYGVPVMHTVWKVSFPDQFTAHEYVGQDNNMTLTQSTEVSEVRILSRLQELTELTELVKSKSSTYRQKVRAINNIKGLSKMIEDQTTTLDSSIQSSTQLQLDAINGTVDQLPEARTQAVDGTDVNGDGVMLFDDAAFGRNYILDNNRDILNRNAVTWEEKGETQSGKQIDADGAVRFVLPPAEKAAAAKQPADKAKMMVPDQSERLNDRKRLLEENIRQNVDFLQQQQQQPPAPAQQPASSQSGDEQSGPLGERKPNEGNAAGFEFRHDSGMTQNRGLVLGGTGGGIDQNANGIVTYTDDLAAIQTQEFTNLFGTIAGVTNSSAPANELYRRHWAFDSDQGSSTPATGGLSIPIQLPLYDQQLVFSKVGGNAQLMLTLSSKSVWPQLLGYLWTGLSLILILWLLFIRKAILAGAHQRELLVLGLLAGLVLFGIANGAFAYLGLLVALVSGVLLVMKITRPLDQPLTETA